MGPLQPTLTVGLRQSFGLLVFGLLVFGGRHRCPPLMPAHRLSHSLARASPSPLPPAQTWVDSKLDSGCIVIGCPEPGCNHPLTFRALERISGEQRFGRFLSLAVQDYKGKADGIMADPALSVWAKENTKQCPVCWQVGGCAVTVR